MDVDKMFESRFIKAGDFNGKPHTFTIAGARLEELEGMTGKKMKGIIELQGVKRAWVINRTNAICCVAMFGRETDAWVGKRITLHPVIWQGEEMAIRVLGSPDLAVPSLPVEVKLPRKKPFTMKLLRTDTNGAKSAPKAAAKAAPAAKSAPAAAEEEAPDDLPTGGEEAIPF